MFDHVNLDEMKKVIILSTVPLYPTPEYTRSRGYKDFANRLNSLGANIESTGH